MQRASVALGGRDVVLETGRIARQADGAVLVRQGDTIVLVAAVAAERPSDSGDFFPLTAEYREKFAAAGRIPPGHIKRERKASDREVLSARLLDRSIRPLFPKGFDCETQVIATVLSFDPEADPEPLAVIGAGAALHLSEIPWAGPVVGLRVARVGGKLVALPTREERRRATLELAASVRPGGLVMLEGGAAEASEEELLEALAFAEEAAAPLLGLLDRWRAEFGAPKRPVPAATERPDLARAVREAAEEPLARALAIPSRRDRIRVVANVFRQTEASIGALRPPEEARAVRGLVEAVFRELVRLEIATAGRRIDGRRLEEIRPITCEVGLLPRAHGSALFTRGETQALVTCTLGSAGDAQDYDGLDGAGRERFLLHYNFLPYCVGEVRPLRGPGRREIGHGELARRAIGPVFPAEDVFPYVVRVDSEITESNGSSSMATVCGATLALMDAGVPLERPVAGIAMGLVCEGGEHFTLSDIAGEEDHLGDMDFKVAGTERGITAIQLDNKLGALPRDLLARALEQARRGRLAILEEMRKTLAAPRPAVSPRAPRVSALWIRPERVRTLIGPGGKTIQEIQALHGVKIEVSDDGKVRILGRDQGSTEAALRSVRRLTDDPEVGKVYRGIVVAVKEFGAFVRILAATEGLVHVSELAEQRVASVETVLKEGDEVAVKVLGVDRQGRLRFSRKEALEVPEAEICDE